MATNPADLFADLVPAQGKAIYGAPPKPKDPKDAPESWRTLTEAEAGAQNLTPGKVWQVSNRGDIKAVGDAAPDALLTDADKADLRAEALQKIKLGASLIKRSKEGWFTTGFGAGAMAAVSGASPAGAVKADTETLKNAGALQKIIELNKKTGKNPLTPLSNSDFQALSSSVTNLDTTQPDEQYQRNVGTLLDIYRRTYQAAGGDPKDIEKILADTGVSKDTTFPGGATAPQGGGGKDEPPPGIGNLTPEQRDAFASFVAKNGGKPSGDQVRTYLKGLLNVTDVPNADAIAKAVGEGRGFSTTTQDLTRQQKITSRIAAENKLGVGDNPATTLAVQGATLGLSDEAAGVGNALAGVIPNALHGKFDPASDYTFGRDVERQRVADAREQLGYGGTAIEFAGGLASGNPTAALSTIGPRLPNAAATAARAAGVSGAVGGALAGFGYGEGAGQSAAGAVGGAAAGGALGRYAPTVVSRVLPRGMRESPQLAPDVARAADAEGVDLIRPMVDPASRTEFSGLEGKAFSQPIIRGAVERTRGQMADATTRLGGGGTALEETGTAGELLQNAGRRFIQRSRNVANRLYDRARTIAGDTRFEPTQAIAQVDNEIAQLQSNPETNAGELNFLNGLRQDLAQPGGKTVEELRQLRTSLRGRISEQSLGATQAEARALRAMDATQQDVAANVPAAATAYRRADSYYRERQTHIDDIIQRITGGNAGDGNFQVSGEAAFKRLKAMASPGGDGRRLAALMRDLEPGERQDIAATIAQSLGRRSADEPFSADRFITMTNQLSPSARRTIFGPDGAQSIQNLRRLSQALKDAGQDINQSRSGTNLERAGFKKAAYGVIATLSGLGGGAGALGGSTVSGTIAGATVGTAALGATALRRQLSARAMVNPRVSRWLADSVNVSSAAQAAQATRKLGVIIAREPALAQELRPVYDMLTARVSPPLAAQPGGQDNGQ